MPGHLLELIITFHGEGDGRLLEARVLTNNT